MPFDFDKILNDPKIKSLAALGGIDLNKVRAGLPEFLAYLKGEVSGPAPADVDAVVEKLRPEVLKLANEAEVRLANKIATAIEKLNARVDTLSAKVTSSGGTVDLEALVKNLGPVVVSTASDVAEKVCQQTLRTFQAAVYEEIDKKAKAAAPPVIGPDGQPIAAAPATGSIRALVDALVQLSSTPIGEKLLDRIFPSPAAQLGDPVKKLKDVYELSKMISGMKLDEKAADALINKLTAPDGTTPPPPAKA